MRHILTQRELRSLPDDTLVHLSTQSPMNRADCYRGRAYVSHLDGGGVSLSLRSKDSSEAMDWELTDDDDELCDDEDMDGVTLTISSWK